MKNFDIYQVDAFTNNRFKGNPAAVVPLREWLSDELLQAIAAENNLSETAYFIKKDDQYHIRWFTPKFEVNLCGHATLAAAHVIWQSLKYDKPELQFQSKSGPLTVSFSDDYYTLNFPTDQLSSIELPTVLKDSLNTSIIETFRGRDDFLVVIESMETLQQLKPDFNLMGQYQVRGLVVTSKGTEVDFVSRCFYPYYGVNEDPVTGSAHTSLAPYWSNKLGKTEMTAQQISERGGFLKINYLGDRTAISGQAVTYLKGQIFID